MLVKDQTVVSVAAIEVDTNVDVYETCTRAVNAAVESFTVKDGRAYVPSDLCPREVLLKTLRAVADTFDLEVAAGLDLSSQEVLHRILQAMFDSDTQDFLERDSSDVFSHLTPEEKDRILAQAIAAATSIFRRLAETGSTITPGILNREAQLYAESEQRAVMHDTIEESQVYDHCHHKKQIAEMILKAMEEGSPAPQTHVDENVDFALNTTAANMGLPWGFHIMTIN